MKAVNKVAYFPLLSSLLYSEEPHFGSFSYFPCSDKKGNAKDISRAFLLAMRKMDFL